MTSTLSSSEQQAIADLGAAVPWMAALVEVEQPLYRVAEMWPLSEPEWAVRCSPAIFPKAAISGRTASKQLLHGRDDKPGMKVQVLTNIARAGDNPVHSRCDSTFCSSPWVNETRAAVRATTQSQLRLETRP